ncbi:hypothetical protein K469DRAFT_443435, partial [Zopfia rhizophila CBS 207.26]
MAHLEAALVLAWDAHGVEVRCPFNCNKKIHSHGYTMPEAGSINSRLAHCVPVLSHQSPRELSYYRLLFPFEDDPLTDGLWWGIDNKRSQEHVGGNTEYLVLDDSPEESNEGDEGLVRAFGTLSIQSPVPWQEKLLFDSHCVNNDAKSAQDVLDRSENPRALTGEVGFPGDKPILLATCEEGHIEVVDWLLKHKPPLEADDGSGETALVRAIQYGYGRISWRLIRAGASTDVAASDGESLLDISRQALGRQEEFRALELHPTYADHPATRTWLRKRELEISALRDVVEQCELQEAKKRAERERKKLVKLHGESQARRFTETNAFDQTEIISEILRKTFEIPLSNDGKIVACLARGTALPYTFAISGYNSGPFGSRDGALDRPTWREKVFQLAELLGHDLQRHYLDEKGR